VGLGFARAAAPVVSPVASFFTLKAPDESSTTNPDVSHSPYPSQLTCEAKERFTTLGKVWGATLDATLIALYLDARCWSTTSDCGRERGNPVKDRDCPAAVSGNDRRHRALADPRLVSSGWEATASRHRTSLAETRALSASPKTCQQLSSRIYRIAMAGCHRAGCLSAEPSRGR
jgi:hypothetical protein